jgi:hypothetical protein
MQHEFLENFQAVGMANGADSLVSNPFFLEYLVAHPTQ